ncbi:MAG: glutathione S-transferase family protein [Pseudomonadales bacterium]|jgi:glutathione S-transferase|nr:glutathione S-transferase family protein [Pseudomonadales bacterium]
MKKLSGQSATPVLEWDREIISGSTAILEFIEQHQPEPALFPANDSERQAALTWCQRLDTELGPAVRSLVFASMINHTSYLVSVFGKQKSAIKLFFYRLMFPLLKPVIAKANGVNPENLKRAEQTVAAYLDDIAEATAETGYLVGNMFTAADLTAASLLATLINPDHPDMAKPEPVLASFQLLLDRYCDHPTMTWVARLYKEKR